MNSIRADGELCAAFGKENAQMIYLLVNKNPRCTTSSAHKLWST
jgi:hypothetical protein